jgi:hypothetical protein
MDLKFSVGAMGASDARLRIPLRPGGSVGHWRLGRRREERFDVAEEPMQGRMDALFFLAGDKNFIPHEYPCRREFAVQYRGKPSEPTIGFEPEGWWFPFGSRRVDLSGFWFRPTRVECWARTIIEAEQAQAAKFRLATCGGALLRVNGWEAGALSGYRRNYEGAAELHVPLSRGENLVEVWFADLCERDARWHFELTLLEGEGLSVAVPVATAPERAAEIERLLTGMRFERPSFRTGEVAIVFAEPASADYRASVTLSGDFLSAREPTLSHMLKRGENRVALGDVTDVPPGFPHVTVTLSHSGFALAHTLAVEIAYPQSNAPPSIEARAAEALAYVAERAEPDSARALARLAVGQGGPETDAMLAACLPPILDCHDCADFLLVPLIWCRTAYGDRIATGTREEIDRAILGFRYWMDEPGNDVMWYFSENHALLFHTAAYLAGVLLPNAAFSRSGRSGAEQSVVGRARLLVWFDHFERWEMGEWNSAPYFPIDFKGLAALFALAPDPDLRRRAERAILRLLEIVALSSHQGMLTASQGRSYEHSLRPCTTLELSAIARLFFGRGGFGSRFHALPLLALCVRDHGLRADPTLVELAFWKGTGALEWCFSQGENGVAKLYHYKTPDHAMGSVACYRPGAWGYQETVLHFRLGERPEAQVWINHPGEEIVSGFARPSYWGGCGTLPRVHQYRDLAIVDFALKPGQVDFTHAWLPEAEFDGVRYLGNRVAIRVGRAMALLIGSSDFVRVAAGPTAACEIRLPGMTSRWILRLFDGDESLDAVTRRFAPLGAFDAGDGAIGLDDPEYGRVICRADGKVLAEGRVLDPATWMHAGRAVVLPGGRETRLPSQGS